MNTKWLVGILVALVVVIGGGYALSQRNNNDTASKNESEAMMDKEGDAMMEKKDEAMMDKEEGMMKDEGMMMKFNPAKKSAHYESNTPAHEAVLAAPPVNVVINFNFDLAAPSAISIMKDGKEYGTGDTTIDANKLALRRNMTTDAPDGVYMISYRACWPDKSCHDGSFEFAIDRSKASSYENMRNKSEVTIRMSELMFAPKNIVISPGTKVTWVNDENVEHYVNTDSHPAHTYYPTQNSRALTKGASYSVTFNKPGAYPYHCSAHADVMVGNIVVA